MASTKLPTTGLRRLPSQQRGEERVELILRSAQTVFTRDGFDKSTTNSIAEEAGVSIGSLYQFFPNKEAMLAAIGDYYRGQLSKLLDDSLPTDNKRPLSEVVATFVDKLADFYDRRPCFRQIYSASRVPSVMSDQSCAMGIESASRIETMLAAYFPALPAAELRRKAIIVVEMVRSLLPVATNAKKSERKKLLDEIKMMAERYLAA